MAQQADADSAAQQADKELDYRATSVHRELRDSRMRGASSTTVQLDSLAPKPLGTFSNVLSSRIPGVLVEQPSGETGAGARIHIRGINSILLPGNPLVIVDGVRVANATTVSTAPVGGQTPSRLDALDPEEIERIEVLPGPAAAALYGGDAADGVLLITTRRGRLGRPLWRLHTQVGAISDITRYPANFDRAGTNPSTGQPWLSCSLAQESQGQCVGGSLTSWNPLENVSPFHTGTQQRHGLSVSGGSRAITYYVAGDYDREDGVYADNEQLQSHARGNLTGRIGRTLTLSASANYVDGMTRLPEAGTGVLGAGVFGGSAAYGVIAYGLFGAAVDDSITRGYFANSLDLAFHDMGPPERLHQYTLGFTADWQPSHWLHWSSTVGLDRVHLSTNQRLVSERVGGLPGDTTVDRATGVRRTDELTVQSGLDVSYGNPNALSATSSIGVRHRRGRVYDRREAEEQIFSSGSDPLTAEVTAELHGDASTTGVYAQQHFSWRQRLILTGGLRRDRVYHTLMQSVGTVPSITDAWANLSWAVGSEPFFPHTSWLDGLRLRAAYGQTARYLDAVSTPPDVLQSAVVFTPIGPDGVAPPEKPMPQRTGEFEAGADATLLHGRLSAALTYYDKRSTHVPLMIVASPFDRSHQLLDDGAAIRNHGFEMLLRGSVLRTSIATGEITLAGATNSNRVDDLRVLPQELPGSWLARPAQYMAPDYPVAGYWGWRFTFADANGDGIISRNEVQVDTAMSFLGSAIPTRELSVAPALTLFHRVTLSALFDYRGGFKQFDANEAVRCGSASFHNCRARFDPASPLAEQAAIVATSIQGAEPLPNGAYIYDASFWKLRELAVSFTAPRRWAQRMAARDVRLTLAGRNLATWTKYPGLDPEINATPSDPLQRADFVTQPPVRYLTVRVDVTW